MMKYKLFDNVIRIFLILAVLLTIVSADGFWQYMGKWIQGETGTSVQYYSELVPPDSFFE